jgi:hypothetical protein
MKSAFICLLPIEAGHIFKTKKLDLSINCMREMAELGKSAVFGGGDYNFPADCISCVISITFNLLPQKKTNLQKYLDYFVDNHLLVVLYTEGWVCDVALIEYTLGPGKPKEGWDFGREGTRGQWGTRGVSLRATWD